VSFTPGLSFLANLMTQQGMFDDVGSTSSSVAVYLWVAGSTFALVGMIAAVMLVVAFTHTGTNRLDSLDFLFMMANVFFVVMLMMTANSIFQLFSDQGCYVSAWSRGYMIAGRMMLMLFVVAFLVYWMIESFTETTEFCKVGVFLFMFTLFAAYTVFSVILSIVNYEHSADNIHVIFNVLLFLSLLEIPYCLCTPTVRKIFNGLHDFRPASASDAAASRSSQDAFDAAHAFD